MVHPLTIDRYENDMLFYASEYARIWIETLFLLSINGEITIYPKNKLGIFSNKYLYPIHSHELKKR